MRMIILHGPCNLVFMHLHPLVHLPLLLHLSPFLPVTQQVFDSQSLFNFLISSFPSHFSSSAWFIPLSQSCCCFSPFCFHPNSHLLSFFFTFLWSSMSWSLALHIAHIYPLHLQVRYQRWGGGMPGGSEPTCKFISCTIFGFTTQSNDTNTFFVCTFLLWGPKCLWFFKNKRNWTLYPIVLGFF